MTKEQIYEAMRAFINQRSGIEWGNYSPNREAFMGDYRLMLKHGRQARAMLSCIEWRGSITADDILKATRAFSGRLQIVEKDGKVRVDYCTGQYFPTEYRKSACAVLVRCLWDYWHSCAHPATDGKETHQPGIVDVGEYIRKQASKNLGRGIAREWFK